MDTKKRKRASFSPTVIVETKAVAKPVAKEIPEEKEPAHTHHGMQQVVEVVVEEPENQKGKITVHTHTQQIPDEDEGIRIKQVPAERTAPHEIEEVAEEVETNEESEELPVEIEEKVEDMQTEEELEETTTEEVSVEPEEPKIAIHKQKHDAEQEEEKETVAELFGKNSETLLPEITVHKHTNTRSLILWAITMVAVAVGVGGGLVVFTNRNASTPSTNSPVVTQPDTTATVSPTSMPKETPTPTIDAKPIVKKAIKIQILNGGGVAGAGSKMKALLEKSGYTVANVANASSYTYTETEINVKASKSTVRDVIEEDIAESYVVGKVESTLPESGEYDARVIVGKE